MGSIQHVALPSVHVSRKSISGQWPLLLQSRRPTGRPATSWCHTHGRSWSSGLLLRLTNGLAAVSTKERKGGDGARRWIEGGSKNGPFFPGTRALPPRCCTNDVLHNLQMAKSCRNSASRTVSRGREAATFSQMFLPDLPLGHICRFTITTGCPTDMCAFCAEVCTGLFKRIWSKVAVKHWIVIA